MRTWSCFAVLAACGSRPPAPAQPTATASAAGPADAAPAPPADAAAIRAGADAAPVARAPDAAGGPACNAEPQQPWPVPSRGHQLAFLCDLPDRVVTVEADDIDEGNVHGTARSIDRASGKVTAAPLLASSPGCTGMMKCAYRTARKGMKELRVHADGRIFSLGEVGDSDEKATMCRRHSPSALAICVTKQHTAALDFGACNPRTATGPAVALEIDVYGAARHGADPSGFETPSQQVPAHLVAVPSDGRTWVYRGSGVELSFDAGRPGGGTLRVGDGAPERCLAYALYGSGAPP